MRILYIINAFSWGGAEKLVFDLALNIRDKVDHVAVAALYQRNDDTEKEMIQTLNNNGISTFIVGKQAGSDRVKSIKSILAFAKEQKISIIHAHCSVPMLMGKIVGLFLAVPVVCTIHNTRGYSKIKERLTAWMTRRYISIGQAAEEYMIQQLKIRSKKITRIYNAIDTEVFSEAIAKQDFWAQFGGSKDEIALINVARVNEQKNQMCLLKAVKLCIDQGINVHAYILGAYDINDKTYLMLDDYIKHSNIEGSVSFLGMHKNVSDFLANADCFVMTSWFEGLSVAFLEAVISGIPIVTTEMPFVEELMRIGPCATVIPQNDDIQLAKVISEKAFYRTSPDVQDRFKTIFAIDQFVRNHLAVYSEVENT